MASSSKKPFKFDWSYFKAFGAMWVVSSQRVHRSLGILHFERPQLRNEVMNALAINALWMGTPVSSFAVIAKYLSRTHIADNSRSRVA